MNYTIQSCITKRVTFDNALWILIVCHLFVGTNLMAAKKSKKNDKKQSAVSAPAEVKKEAETEDLRRTGPAEIQRDAFADKKVDYSSKANVKRDEAIAEIKKILPTVKGGQKGELIFRLAELYWEKSQFLYRQEFNEYDTDYQKWYEAGRKGKEPDVKQYLKESEVYKRNSLENYKTILEEYPDYPRLDEVLYIMAYNKYDAGKKDAAIEDYSRLIRQYPKSEYVSDAYLALGEHYFKANSLEKATKAYKKAYDVGIDKKRPGVFRFALYKLAWCDFNANQYPEALTKFKKVVQESNKAGAGGGNGKKEGIQLKREALNDMVLTYARLNNVDEAYTYFKKEAGDKEAYRLTTKMAMVYRENGAHKEQIETLRMLLKINPDTTSAPDFQSDIVTAHEKMQDRDGVRREITKLVELYKPGTPWYRKNEKNQTAVERARAVAENRMRELVTEYHAFATKFNKVDDYLVARDIYAQYLQAFPDSESAYRLNFYYAELLWDLGQWRDAAAQYDSVVKRDPKGEHTRNSAFNAVLAWDKIVNKEPPPTFEGGVLRTKGCTENDKSKACQKRKDGSVKKTDIRTLTNYERGKKYEKEKIPAEELSLANACDAYVAAVPESVSKGNKDLTDELLVVKFKAAYIFQSHNHFDDAAKRFGELIDRWPSSDYARKAADQILDSYDAREDWPNLEKWARTFSKNKPLMGDSKFASQTNKYIEGASFKLVEGEMGSVGKGKDKQQTLAVAEKFDGFVSEFPNSEFAPFAVYNAQVLYAGQDYIDKALGAANTLLGKYNKQITTDEKLKSAKVEEKTMLDVASYYEKMAQFDEAAAANLKFVNKYKDHAKAPDALYNAAVQTLGLGRNKEAISLFNRYMKEYSKQKDVPDVYLTMAKVVEDEGDWKKTSETYNGFEKQYASQGKPEQVLWAKYKSAYALQKQGKDKEMRTQCSEVLGYHRKMTEVVKKSEIGQVSGGYCAFQVLEDNWSSYKAIQIVSKAGQAPKKVIQAVKEALDLKKKKRDEIAKSYIDVLSYGNGEWGVAGLSRAAESLLDYVKTLREAPDPPVLANNPEALDLFRTELENIAFPVEDQAIQALDKALEKAYELGIYSSYTLGIQDQLKKFKPSRFGRIYELPLETAMAGDAKN